jgi:6-phosphogluconolactonase
MTRLEIFDDRETHADAAADAIAEALAELGDKSFLATGGTTPGPVYDRISRMDLDWASCTVAPTDERFVDPTSPDSNEPLLRGRLLVDQAAAARFVPLKGRGATPDEDAARVEPALRAMLPSRAVLLGMGADGHFNSLFPGDPDLAARLDPAGMRLVVGVAMSSVKPYVPRISLTARALLETGLIVVFITGDEKRTLLERVLADEAFTPPIATIVRQDQVAVRVLWAR